MFVDEFAGMSAHSEHRTRTLWLTGVLHVFTHLYHVALLPLYLLIQRDEHFGIKTVEEATFLMTVLMLSYYIPSYVMGVLADRFSKRKLLGLGLAINALGFVGLALSRNFGQAIASMVISGIGGELLSSLRHIVDCAVVSRSDGQGPRASGHRIRIARAGVDARGGGHSRICHAADADHRQLRSVPGSEQHQRHADGRSQ